MANYGIKSKAEGELVMKYLKKFNDLPTMTLAKKIHAENPDFGSTVEAWRTRIRYYREQSGKQNRAKLSCRDFASAPGEAAAKMKIGNPFCLPESDEAEYEPFLIPSGVRKLLVLSDIHIPYHNIQALTTAIQYGIDNGADGILLNGDTMDMYKHSRFIQDPRKRDFKGELELTRQLLGVLRKQFPGAHIYWKDGNHDERWENWLMTNAPMLLDMPEFRLDVLLRFGEYGATKIGEKRIIKAGKLNILHGHEMGKGISSPVNPARGAYTRAKESVLIGHHHQTSEHSENNLSGHVVTTWSTGCLSELHPSFLPINKWNLGFAFVEIDSTGDYEVRNMRIINGKVR